MTTIDWRAVMEWLPGLCLHFVRVGAFLAGQSLFGARRDARMPRLVLAIALGSTFFWLYGAPVVAIDHLAVLAFLAAREVIVGLALGLAVRLVTAALASAGEILTHEMGFAMAQVVDPANGRPSTVVAQFLEVMGVVLLFELDLHHDILRAFAAVYALVPVGAAFSIDAVQQNLAAMVGDAIEFGMRYALPVVGVMVVLTAVLVVLGRALPHLNLLEFTFGVRAVLALLASLVFLIEGAPFLERVFATSIDRIRLLFVTP